MNDTLYHIITAFQEVLHEFLNMNLHA